MHKKSIIMIAMVALMIVTVVPVFAAKTISPAATNGLQKGKTDHLYLYEKDSETWDIVEDGAWGKLNINTNKGTFVFNGHALEPETAYVLICYQDPWPGTDSLVLGSATSNEEGNVHIKGSIDYDILPSYTYDTDGDEVADVEGSKIWLVLASDFDDEEPTEMSGWTPSEYLFEFDLINQSEIE
ncbi:MAG: hypothetical protein NWF06_11120 [Candidatus Bathyarchaeota archaeon]|nr:hypothetical protein [Candidatus Bathyarchaeum sp.]